MSSMNVGNRRRLLGLARCCGHGRGRMGATVAPVAWYTQPALPHAMAACNPARPVKKNDYCGLKHCRSVQEGDVRNAGAIQ